MTQDARHFCPLTLIGMVCVAYTASVFLHEAGGHGLACVASGAHPRSLGAYYFDCDTHGMSLWVSRVVEAAGSTVNLLIAVVAWTFLQRSFVRRTNAVLFCWLLFAVNSLEWSGYYLFSGFSGLGDWGGTQDGVFFGVRPQWAWRVALSAAGTALYLLCAWLSARRLGRVLGGSLERRKLGFRITLTAYVTGAVVSVLTSLLNPLGFIITLLSAAASSLGGTSGLLWLPSWIPRNTAEPPLSFPRSWIWILSGAVVVAVYAALLGPSVHFR